MRRLQQQRLQRLEARRPRGCPTCRRWTSAVLMDDDGNTDRPERCLDCGRYVPITGALHIVGVPLDAF